MELIYTAVTYQYDVGIIPHYSLDLAYGSDENSYTLTVPLSEHVLSQGRIWYIIDVQDGKEVYTEYGGVVDNVAVNTEEQTVIYSGRTWQGVLASAIVLPPSSSDYLTVSGDANACMYQARLNSAGGLDVDARWAGRDYSLDSSGILEESGIDINAYQFNRYEDLYTSLRKMLSANNCKVKVRLEFIKEQVIGSYGGSDWFFYRTVPLFYAEQINDYSTNEEWDSSQIKFTATKAYKCSRTLICLGSGELAERHRIDLKMDSNGDIRQYTKDSNVEPVQDSDYILPSTIPSGEIVAVYDYPNAETTINYVPLSSKPIDWETNYSAYYEQASDGSFDNVEEPAATEIKRLLKTKPTDWESDFTKYYIQTDTGYENLTDDERYEYVVQTSKPSDWAKNFTNYYFTEGSGYELVKAAEILKVTKKLPEDWWYNYKSYYLANGSAVDDITTQTMKVIRSQPKDWKTNWADYYYYDSDGTESGSEWKSIGAAEGTKHVIQTQRPSDWATTWEFGEITSKGKKSARCYCRQKKYTYLVTDLKTKKSSYQYVTYFYTQTLAKANKKTLPSASKLNAIWKTKQYFTTHTYDKIPAWASYYPKYRIAKKIETISSPMWESGKYYTKVKSTTAPTWKSGTYYTKTLFPPDFVEDEYYEDAEEVIPPTFSVGQYYDAVEDHYADLVAGGIERLQEMYENDSIDIDLTDLIGDYDVGDIIGASDEVTGISIRQPITKKILKAENGRLTLSYEIGGTT